MCFFKCVGSLCFLCRLGFSSPMEPSHQRAELSKVCTKTSSGLKPGENFEKNLGKHLGKTWNFEKKCWKRFGKRASYVQTGKFWTFDMPQCLMTHPHHVRKFYLAIFLRLPSPSFAFLRHLPSTAPSAPSSKLWWEFSWDVQMVVDAVDPHRRPRRNSVELGGTRT